MTGKAGGIGDVLSHRPTLAMWLAEYAAIEADFVDSLRASGIDVAERGALAAQVEAVRDRLRAKGAAFRNGGASIVSGALSSACVACTGGLGSKTFTLSTACNRSCYFCFNANQADYASTRLLKENWRDELDGFLACGDVTHIALTGGEPLLHSDEAVGFFARANARYPEAHLRLYTAGDFLDEGVLARLAEAGLSELRLSVKVDVLDGVAEAEAAIAEALRRVRLAKRFVPDVMVEMPVIPGTGDAMRMLLRGLAEVGAFGINLLEFGYPMGGWSEFGRRGFLVANPPFPVMYDYGYAAGLPVAGSELLCLKLLEFSLDEGLDLGVHYCSLENKHRDQVLQQNRAARLDPRIWELDAEDFFWKAVKVFDGDVDPVRRALAERGLPYREDAEEGSLLFARRHVAKIGGLPVAFALSTNVLEDAGDGLAVRELRLEVMEGCGIMGFAEENVVEKWTLRAAACELLAFSLRYPGPEVAEAVASGEWAEAAEEVSDALRLVLPEGFAADARANEGEDADALLHTLRAEATRLFVGSPEPACSPYEGIWRAADDGVQGLLFVNPHSMAVERFCRSCGLGRPEGTNEPLDHAATELELLQYLASLEAGIVQPAEGAPAAADLPGGSAAAAYGEFLQDHALIWLPRFAEKLAAETRQPFYRAVAALLGVWLAEFSVE